MRLLLFFLLIAFSVQAQFTYVLSQDVPVLHDDETLNNAWAGGLNAAQINTLDLNGDGKNDLAVFDRMANRMLTFLNLENRYVYTPAYEKIFPAVISGFVLLRDYNCDGRPDLFTQDVFGIRVFKNVTVNNGPLAWEPVLFYPGSAGTKSNVLLTKGFSGKVNLQLQFDDLPALVDADGDGDLDIFNVKFVGNTIEYHKNFSMERYGTCDSLDFERITQNWGNVEECECGEFAFGTSCPSHGRLKHSSGKALFALDIDKDNDIDILFSEGECSLIFQLINEGDNDNPVVTSATAFPAPTPVQILQFPAVYYEDVDFDGIKDLIASPNIFAREFFQTDLKQSVWLYKNTGTNDLPDFEFQNRNFLQGDMIDVGDNAVPAFYDADGDGDLDMFLGTFINGTRASIYYYENTGTRYEPAYKLITDDFAGLSIQGFTNIKPQFADINGDAKTDLVFTASNQFGVNTNLYYLPNKSHVGLNFSGQQVQTLNFPILSSTNILVTHINTDLLPDLLVGLQNGSLQYWENTGTPSTPAFTLANSSYLGMGHDIFRQHVAVAAGDLNADGKPELVIGNQTGTLTVIDNFKEAANAASAATDIIYNPIHESYSTHNLGGKIWPTITNMFSTNKPAIVIGNRLGGLHLLKPDESTPLPDEPQIVLYPNPVVKEKSTTITISVDRPAVGYVVSTTGQVLGSPLLFQGHQLYQFDVEGLSPGLYVIRFFINGKSFSRRFVVV